MGCQSGPTTMLICIIRHEDMEKIIIIFLNIYIYMLVENVNMDVLVEIYINDLEIIKMDNIHYINLWFYNVSKIWKKCI
jgi:hypothetical protein